MRDDPAATDRLGRALQVWGRLLLHHAAQDMHTVTRQTGLSASQVGTLFLLHRHGGCQVTDLGQTLGLTTAAASHLVERMVQLDLLERRAVPGDRRARRVLLSAGGHSLVAQLTAARLAWLTRLARSLTPREQQSVARALECLARAARTQPDGPGAPDAERPA